MIRGHCSDYKTRTEEPKEACTELEEKISLE
jgi:hypothetical protein